MFLVGRGITHSLSPAMWNHLWQARGDEARYGLRDVAETELGSVLEEIGSGRVLAANVTMPYKGWAAEHADLATDEVVGTGAANFLQPRDGGLFADNTDVRGAARLLRRLDPPGEVVVLGAGGTASALLLALAGIAERVTIVNRSPERARRLAALHAHRFPVLEWRGWEDRDTLVAEADLLVNTIPLVEDAPVRLPMRSLRIYDAIYRDTPTALQTQAVRDGHPLCDGLSHLAAQAIAMLGHVGLDESDEHLLVEGLETATGRSVLAWDRPLSPGRTQGSVWLVGMMGSGKSTVGRRLAERLDRDFVDLDEVVEGMAGLSIAVIWDRSGEDAFRRLERAALERLAGTKAVIATGGGAVLDDRNVERMRASGLVAWLDAPVGVLADRVREGAGRPLLRGADTDRRLAEVLAVRRPRYRAAAHRVFVADRPPAEIVEEIERWIAS